ncbi:MAG: hemerythrin domain-containing protein [Planctomycetes bacterium]|nr:hemerythrin domain-containing protein [Planctomycetota bacterium]
MTTIYDRLLEDHGRQRELAAAIAATSGDSDERRSLWSRYRAELEAHANAEEQTLYAALIERPDGQEQARHSIHEHEQQAELIAKVEQADWASSAWLQHFGTLRHEIEHHLDEEEADVFPLSRRLLSDDVTSALAEKFDGRKQAELGA